VSEEEFGPLEQEPTLARQEAEDAPSLSDLRGTLVTASSLLPSGYEEDEGDFEPGGRYRGFEIVPPAEWPQLRMHAHVRRRFYVRHNDTMGLVPWPGSKIIWPWEQAWEQDLHRETVTSYLKDDEKKGGKRGRAT